MYRDVATQIMYISDGVNLSLMEIDIQKLKNDLESKINALIEVQNNFIKSSKIDDLFNNLDIPF